MCVCVCVCVLAHTHTLIHTRSHTCTPLYVSVRLGMEACVFSHMCAVFTGVSVGSVCFRQCLSQQVEHLLFSIVACGTPN